MVETSGTPEIKIATQEANGIITTPSKVEMKNFSPEELQLVNARLTEISQKAESGILKHENALVTKKEKLEKMIADLQKEKADAEAGKEAKLTQDEVLSVITEDDFEQDANPVQQAVETVAALASGDPEEVKKILDKSGVMPDNFFKKIFEWIHKYLGDTRISYDQTKAFDGAIAPYLEKKGFDLYKKSRSKDGKEISSINPDERVKIMNKLSNLGIPVAESGKFFGYVLGDVEKSEVPKELQELFEAGRVHYAQNISETNNMSAMGALNTMLDFVPPHRETPPDNTPPVATKAPENKDFMTFTDSDGKSATIEAEETSKKSFTNIAKTAEIVLGSEPSIATRLKDEYKKNAKTVPKEKGEEVLKEVTIQLAKAIRDKTAVLGSASIVKLGTASLGDETFAEKSVETIDKDINSYITLAITEIQTRIKEAINAKFILNLHKSLRDGALKNIHVDHNILQKLVKDDNKPDAYAQTFKDIVAQAKEMEKINKMDDTEIAKLSPQTILTLAGH